MKKRKPYILKIVGRNIRKLRESGQFTLGELAKRADCNANYLGSVERGQKNISVTKLKLVADALDVQASSLLLPSCLAETRQDQAVDAACILTGAWRITNVG